MRVEYFPSSQYGGISERDSDQKMAAEEFEDRIIFMSMFNDIDRKVRTSPMYVSANSLKVRDDAKRFQKRRWSLLGPGDEEKWYGTHDYKPEGKVE